MTKRLSGLVMTGDAPAALAEFLAPAVIISADSVFTLCVPKTYATRRYS